MSDRRPTLASITARFTPVDVSDSAQASRHADPEAGQAVHDQPSPPSIPDDIANLVVRRTYARQRYASTTDPKPGHIVRLDANLASQDGITFNEPAIVLLDTLNPDLRNWNGWLVGRDPHMASAWDLILGPEEEARDPLCEVVQCWNPLTIPTSGVVATLAILTSARLHAARMLAADSQAGQGMGVIPIPLGDHRPGIEWARILSDGTGVITGTELVNSDLVNSDPRAEYQRLYRMVAEAITRQTCLAAQQPSEAAPTLLQRLREIGATWRDAAFVHSRPIAVAATLAIAPLIVLSIWQGSQDAGTEHPGKDLYLGEGELQTLSSPNPEQSMRALDEQLRGLGIMADIHSYPDGTGYVIQADAASIKPADWDTLEKTWGVRRPQGGKLRLLVIEQADSAK